nr:ATP-binding protein [Brevibacillus laterosporus]
MHVSDKGIQMDPTRLQLKRNTVPLHKENLTQGGLGLYLIETLMDSVEIYQQEGTTISMTKYVQQDEVKKSDREQSVREGT